MVGLASEHAPLLVPSWLKWRQATEPYISFASVLGPSELKCVAVTRFHSNLRAILPISMAQRRRSFEDSKGLSHGMAKSRGRARVGRLGQALPGQVPDLVGF